MRWVKNILGFFLVFTVIFLVGNKIVFGGYNIPPIPGADPAYTSGGYTLVQIVNAYCSGSIEDCNDIPAGQAGSTNTAGYTPGQLFSGYYQAPNGNFYPIGVPVVVYDNPGTGGSGPEDDGTGACTGVYGSCSVWGACSPTCGPGTQTRQCFDTGCGAILTESQSCMVNDPDVWGPPTTCSVNCGTGTQNITNQCGTTVPQACNTSACPAWIKLKDSSFISIHPLTDMLALAPVAYDDDDTTEQFFIVGDDGVVAAPVININISNVTPTAKTGNPEYKALYTPTYSMTPALFLSYVKARKEYKVITDLGEISGSGIYVFNGDVSIDSASSPFNGTGNIVLLSTGTVTVSRVAPSTTFTPGGTVALIAPTINFNDNLTEATGIFIGNTVSTGTNATQGLKIIGNLIAQTTLSNNREWPTTARPSLFIKFDQTKYINLLPYLSTASYQWREVIINQRFAETCQVLHFYSLPTSTGGSPKSGGQIIRRLCSGGVLL